MSSRALSYIRSTHTQSAYGVGPLYVQIYLKKLSFCVLSTSRPCMSLLSGRRSFCETCLQRWSLLNWVNPLLFQAYREPVWKWSWKVLLYRQPKSLWRFCWKRFLSCAYPSEIALKRNEWSCICYQVKNLQERMYTPNEIIWRSFEIKASYEKPSPLLLLLSTMH